MPNNIYSPIARVISILRINYGQYWLRELEKWDIREQSLGTYCSDVLGLQWSLDAGNTWSPFMPNERTVTTIITSPSPERFREYLTEEDWKELAKVVQKDYEPSLAASILSRTHQFLDQRNWKEALIEGNTALEIAIGEFIRQRLHHGKTLSNNMSAFQGLPLRVQVTALGTFLEKVSLEDVEYTLKAITMRNDIVHEGWQPSSSTEVQASLGGLLKIVTALLPGPGFKFPKAGGGNMLRSVEEWEQYK